MNPKALRWRLTCQCLVVLWGGGAQLEHWGVPLKERWGPGPILPLLASWPPRGKQAFSDTRAYHKYFTTASKKPRAISHYHLCDTKGKMTVLIHKAPLIVSGLHDLSLGTLPLLPFSSPFYIDIKKTFLLFLEIVSVLTNIVISGPFPVFPIRIYLTFKSLFTCFFQRLFWFLVFALLSSLCLPSIPHSTETDRGNTEGGRRKEWYCSLVMVITLAVMSCVIYMQQTCTNGNLTRRHIFAVKSLLWLQTHPLKIKRKVCFCRIQLYSSILYDLLSWKSILICLCN